MPLSINTAPTVEPLSLSEVKSFLRIDNSVDDEMLTLLLTAARQMAEDFTNRAFITTTFDYWLDRWPKANNNLFWDGVREASAVILSGAKREVTLPKPPLISIVHVKTYSDADAATTFSSSSYIVDTDCQPGRIILKNGYSWPLDLRVKKAINIQFTAGYGSGASSVPAQIRQAILMICAKLYETRGEDSGEIPGLAKQLLSPYRVLQIGDTNEMPRGFR